LPSAEIDISVTEFEASLTQKPSICLAPCAAKRPENIFLLQILSIICRLWTSPSEFVKNKVIVVSAQAVEIEIRIGKENKNNISANLAEKFHLCIAAPKARCTILLDSSCRIPISQVILIICACDSLRFPCTTSSVMKVLTSEPSSWKSTAISGPLLGWRSPLNLTRSQPSSDRLKIPGNSFKSLSVSVSSCRF